MFSLRRFAAGAGIACALSTAGPISVAGAAASAPGAGSVVFRPPIHALPPPSSSCNLNQGLLSGFPDLGPLGSLAPSQSPIHASVDIHCGIAIFNAGPTG
jgi:hypothetical protein